MGSIRRHRHAMTALLAEYSDKTTNAVDTTDDFDDYIYGQKRRQDNDIQGGMCKSLVRYARPQKARSASGEWKYIVNTGQHTQTLRLEKCMSPQESCSYLAVSYRSHCAQVYNYHRLLSWDKTRGLHVDIFKVPTCCSCQIDGYKQQFPALVSEPKQEDFTPIYKGELYQQYQQQQQQQLDYTDEEEDEDEEPGFSTQYQHYKHDDSFDANELSSNRVKSKVPSPTVGSYLSPPGNGKYEQTYLYKYPTDTVNTKTQKKSPSSMLSSSASSKQYSREIHRRRPHKSYGGDSRSDLDFSPSEQHVEREVNDFGTANGKDESSHQKRKTIYSVTHTASTGSSVTSDSSTTAFPASTGTIPAVTPTTTTRHRRPTLVDTNAHQKPSITATTNIPTTSTAAGTTTGATSSVGTASLPTHYYTRSRHVLKNQSRLRIPYTITSTKPGAGGGGDQENIAAPATEFGPDVMASTTTTTTATSSSTQPPDVYAVNPEIFKNHYKTIFNLNYTTVPTLTTSTSSTPKRINYSYHPIIDFFEYNQLVTAKTKTTATPQTSRTGTENSPTSTRYLSSTHLYPHIITKAVPAQTQNHPRQHDQQHQHQQQIKYRTHQTQRRIGYGAAAAAVAAATDGDGFSSSSSTSSGGVVIKILPHNTNSNIPSGLVTPITADVSDYEPAVDVWHPVILQDF